jgi:two-component system NtrC family response regulator
MSSRVLVVDDDKNLAKVVEYNLKEDGHETLYANSAEEALELLARAPVDLVLTDVRMAGMGGMELLKRLRAERPDLPVILITAFAAIDSAVEAIKAGADDYIPKPFNQDDLKYKVRKALMHRRLARENQMLRAELAQHQGLPGMIGASPAMHKVFELITQVASSHSTVLITGASGTGKELAARAIHYLSPRADAPFVAVNCAAIPRELLESDLFGHVRGAFTGAVRDQTGKFELADRGAIFLDEIGDLDLGLQPKLLRVLQEHELQRVGDPASVKVDVRVIAATQADLRQSVAKGKFREDLFYRLNVIPITLPPLSARRGDVPLLADHFLKKFGGESLSWSREALESLEKYAWPGNVRELENLVERLCVLLRGRDRAIAASDLPAEITSGAGPAFTLEGKTFHEAEKELIARALEKAGGNRSRAARSLAIPRHVLLYRMKKYGI